ncbi:aldehyde dehydrogenase family protein [Microbacterium sp. No. 7]|uniref:aldehyde dehydrogenase family protein n=1 Tax=Microbacterium sp. No. 7 TaxID=1714373 RepID=UPI0006D2561F|nr:aldehyde dehydrogenase family protein [Microbacterium sp. No. 7]ALJ19589.1 hypothetical protein AOA12_06565 [Microbacterium sp. No. 7]
MSDTNRLYIDGAWVTPHSGETVDVLNPTTEEVLATIPNADADDVDAAVEAAERALPAWAALGWEKRAEHVAKLLDYLEEHNDELVQTIAKELGCPVSIAQVMHVGLPVAEARSQIEFAKDVEWQREIGNTLVVKEPVGVVAAIAAWNFPMILTLRKMAPALLAGCTMVLKPSVDVSLFAFIVARAAEAAGVPAGVFNLVTGRGETTGEALITHPKVNMLSFTGSTAGGRRMAKVAAEDFKRIHLELGGKSAMVTLPDADVTAAVNATTYWTWLNTGQACSALTRIIVPREKLAEAEEAAKASAAAVVVGDPLSPQSTMGPLVSERQLQIVNGYIEKGLADGSKLVVDGRGVQAGTGYFLGPTVFSDVAPGSTIDQEEIFGPVLSITPYDTVEEAIEIANGTPYGLAAGVYGPEEQAFEVAAKLKAGQVQVNDGQFNPLAPFGGFKQSGIGRENGPGSIDEYLEVKAIQR